MADPQSGINPQSLIERRLAAQNPAMRGSVTDPEAQRQMDLNDIMYTSAGKLMGGGDPNVAAAWQQRGRNITAVLQERWFKKEMEGFEQQSLNPAQQKLRQLEDSLVERFGQLDAGQLVAPDGSVQEINPNSTDAMRMKQQLLYTHTHEMGRVVDEIFQTATKYGSGNPLIAARLTDIMSSTSDSINSIVSPAIAMQQKAYEEVEFTKAKTRAAEEQAGMYSRMPAGASQQDDSTLSQRDLLVKYGAPSLLTRTLEGKNASVEPFRVEAAARIEQEIVEDAMSGKDPNFSASVGVTFDKNGKPQSGVNMDLVKNVAATRNTEIMERATLQAWKTWFRDDPKATEYAENVLKHRIAAPAGQPTPEKIEGLQSKETINARARSYWEQTLKGELTQAVSEGQIRTKEDIENWLQQKVSQVINERVTGDPTSQESGKKIGDTILLIAKKEWKDIPLLKQQFDALTGVERVGKGIWSVTGKPIGKGLGLIPPEE